VDGRVAIVTGAGDGLGRAEALALARAGDRIIVNDIGEAAHQVATRSGATWYGVLQSDLNGRLTPAEAEADLRTASRLLLAPMMASEGPR
jgi:NAD(P)-dependent dehydrogenase (short-subunit alcohol dehydrogenase family)